MTDENRLKKGVWVATSIFISYVYKIIKDINIT